MREIGAASREIAQAVSLLRLAMSRLESALKEGVQPSSPRRAFNRGPAPANSPEEYRGKHRPGHPLKLDIDVELRAFVVARLDRMGYVQIAADVAEHLPPDRRIGKTAIWKWYRRRHPD